MRTLSEFRFDTSPYILGGLGGAGIGNQYSKQGKTRTQLSKDLAKASLIGGALYSGVDAIANKGKNIGKSLKEGAKSSLQFGSSSIIGGQLGYRNKYKKQYDENQSKPQNKIMNAIRKQRSDKGQQRGTYK